MEVVTRYRCEYCGKLFDGEKECLRHEERHRKINKANEMLNGGFTLKEINDECEIWTKEIGHWVNNVWYGGIPEYLLNIIVLKLVIGNVVKNPLIKFKI